MSLDMSDPSSARDGDVAEFSAGRVIVADHGAAAFAPAAERHFNAGG